MNEEDGTKGGASESVEEEEMFPYATGDALKNEIETNAQNVLAELRAKHAQEVRELEAKVSTLSKSLALIGDEKSAMGKKFKEDRKLLIERYREQVNEAESRSSEHLNRARDLQKALGGLEKKCEDMKQRFEKAVAEKNEQGEEKLQQIRDLKQTLQRQQVSHKSEMENQAGMIKELNKLVGKERQNMASIQNQMVKAQKGTEDKVDGAKKVLTEYQKKVQTLNKSIGELEEIVATRTSTISALEAEREDMQRKLDDLNLLQGRVKSLEMELDERSKGYSLSLEAERRGLLALESRVESAQAQSFAREQQCLELEDRINEMSIILGKYEQNKAKDQDEIRRLLSENMQFEEMLAGRQFSSSKQLMNGVANSESAVNGIDITAGGVEGKYQVEPENVAGLTSSSALDSVIPESFVMDMEEQTRKLEVQLDSATKAHSEEVSMHPPFFAFLSSSML